MKEQERSSTLYAERSRQVVRANEPKRNNENGNTAYGGGNAVSADVLHRRDQFRNYNDDICPRTIAKNARVAIAVGKEIGELEATQRDHLHRIENGECQTGATDGDGQVLGGPFGKGIVLTSFREASEDRREDGEEHDNNSKHSVEDVSQGTTPQTDGRGVDDNDHGCTGCSKLEKKR